MGKIVQTAGRNILGEFAPEFAHFNDDVLFGENWNNQDIDVKTRSIITVVALMASGITDSSLKYHLQNAKNHGVTQKEIAAVITHAAFYAGWPKAPSRRRGSRRGPAIRGCSARPHPRRRRRPACYPKATPRCPPPRPSAARSRATRAPSRGRAARRSSPCRSCPASCRRARASSAARAP